MHFTNPNRGVEFSLRIVEMVIKRSPKLGYHRIIVACGRCLPFFGYCKVLARNYIQTLHNDLISITSFLFLPLSTNMSHLVEHCRRRKVRCRVDKHDEHGRCENCLRLEKSCNFFRNPRAFSSANNRRIRPSRFDGVPLQGHSPNPISVLDGQPLKAVMVEETCKLTEILYSDISAGKSTGQNDPHYFKDRTKSLGGPSGISSRLTAQGPPVTSSSQAIRKTSPRSMLGSPSSLNSHAQGEERAPMTGFDSFVPTGNLAFHFLEPQKPRDPEQYTICHCTECFPLPQPKAWAKDTHRSSSSTLDITNIQSSGPDFLETPEPTTRGEGSISGSCSSVYSTSWNMLSASSFGDMQAENTVACDCENRFSAASSRTTICERWSIPEACNLGRNP